MLQQIHILEIFDPMAKMPDRAIYMFEFEDNESQAELRALRWLEGRPNDIVMFVEVQNGEFCKFCDQPIKEKAGWILHRWIHERTGAYTCENDHNHQAEPK